MKIPSSSSSSSLERSLNNSEDITGKCFFSIIRRFLCTGNLRTHPSDSIKETNHEVHKEKFKLEETIQGPPTPGLVARLMGLDSMPELDIVVHNQKKADSFRRSRSVSSVDILSEFEPKHQKHRRVKTSLSLQEIPTFLELENDDFLLLSFENVHENKDLRPNGRKSEMGFEEKKKTKVWGSKNKENKEEQNRVSMKNKKDEKEYQKRRRCGREILKPLEIKDLGLVHLQNEGIDESKLAKTTKKCRHLQKKVESECKSENSSPVSVFDLDEFQTDHESSLSAEEETRGNYLTSRRKLNPDVVNLEYPSHGTNHISITPILGSKSIHFQGSTDELTRLGSRAQEENYKEYWEEICKLIEEDMKSSNWILKEMQKMEELEEIGTEFGIEIVNQIIEEMIIEVCEFPTMNFAL